MEMIIHTYFEDQGRPAFGSGWRNVIVESEGHKWVKLINPHTLATTKLKRDVWDRMYKRPLEPNKRKLERDGKGLIKAVDVYGIASAHDDKSERKHKARVRNLKGRLKRVLNAV
jgi:hypothetical protein